MCSQIFYIFPHWVPYDMKRNYANIMNLCITCKYYNFIQFFVSLLSASIPFSHNFLILNSVRTQFILYDSFER